MSFFEELKRRRVFRVGLVYLVAAMALAAVGTACDDQGPNGETEAVSVAFAATTQSGLSIALAPPIIDSLHTIDLTGVTIAFDEIVLERDEDEVETDSDSEFLGEDDLGGADDSDADSDSDGAGNEGITTGPVSIDLQLDGSVVTSLSTRVPAGRYEEIEMDIASLRFVGTYDGQAFDVLVPLDLELETEFEPPMDVQEELSLTVRFDVAAWFREADGSVIDPRALETDAALRSRLMQRIALSLDTFEDSDHDGDDTDSDSDLND